MRKYRALGISAVVCLVVLLLLWLRDGGRRESKQFAPASATDTATVATQDNGTNTVAAHAITNRALGFLNPKSPISRGADLARRIEEVRSTAAERNLPINFWGKVVDQDGLPLAGVHVQMTVRHWVSEISAAMVGRFPRFTRETDPNGRFELTGQAGDVLEFESIQKSGYRLSPKALTALNYEKNPNPPSAENPLVFKMRKIGTAEPLIAGKKFYGIIPDGRAYTIDLIKGTKVEGESAEGDLRVKIMRPAKIQPHERFGWSVVIETVSGGVLPTDDEFLYQAPANGYVSPYQLEFTSAQANWADRVKQQFYVRSRGGAVYGVLDVEILSSYNDKSVFNVKWTVNPAGSRNLEPASDDQ